MYRITSDMENSTGNADFPPHLPLSPSSEGPRAQRPSASHPPGPVGHPEVPKHPVPAGMVLPEDLPVQQAHLGKGWTTAALPPQRLKVKIRPARGTGSGRRGPAVPSWSRSFFKNYDRAMARSTAQINLRVSHRLSKRQDTGAEIFLLWGL